MPNVSFLLSLYSMYIFSVLISSYHICVYIHIYCIHKTVRAAVGAPRLELFANKFLILFSGLGNVSIIIHVCVYGNHTFSTVA